MTHEMTDLRLRRIHQRLEALEAALAQQAEPVQEPVAWVASKDGRVIYDDASTDDGLLRVSGDFENDEQRARYAQRIVDKLNAAPPQRTMVPLTEEDLRKLADKHLFYQLESYEASGVFALSRAVERAVWDQGVSMNKREPIAWMVYTVDGQSAYVTDNPSDIKEGQSAYALYPGPFEQVLLTDDEIYHATGRCGVSRYTAINIARAVERAVWEKNHG